MSAPLPHHSPADVATLAEAAAQAFPVLAQSSPAKRAQLLRAIADQIEALGDTLIDCVCAESALPRARVQGERGRTTAQLRMFATLAEADLWREPRTDDADPNRQPAPRPRIHSERRPIGPVAVFGASNFPLAFSVAGGDSASALAIGCPVVAKAHPAHPETCRLISGAIDRAVAACALPPAVFQVFFESGFDAGQALVQHPAIKAAAFTGSRRGGMALWRLAQNRRDPIPFFAEMSSVNPVFITPACAKADPEGLATGLVGSMTLGVGQFCTQPGLLFVTRDSAPALVSALIQRVQQVPPGTMLTAAMAAHYRDLVEARRAEANVQVLAEGAVASDPRQAQAMLFGCDLSTFLSNDRLQDEVFGPSSLVIEVDTVQDFETAVANLDGQLTATLWHQPGERDAFTSLLWQLEQKVGRIVFNGYPTGVEVGSATVHGGPFPACSDARFTSVGTRAIDRFLRVVAWQEPA
ncbi:aldehyde dehydrogenase (NADP(+)) [Ahniella affigens]|uniref:Aldehyde dehydrogenase (NADP(+)) n=1 Tax=Ahniella affigens TaxID=2021234 RepID=A0A2P1PXN9_9GAMM|nr:aldehyde dehydrogenase (NADP(+)) [Ahniella affigens]AVP99592.1 aldehyde dehydrogenase (NADP(+)) [Ahniella affigens]